MSTNEAAQSSLSTIEWPELCKDQLPTEAPSAPSDNSAANSLPLPQHQRNRPSHRTQLTVVCPVFSARFSHLNWQNNPATTHPFPTGHPAG